MKNPDARHLSIATQNYLRQQAIRLRKQGKRVGDISEYLGVHAGTVSKWWNHYQSKGKAALWQLQRGHQTGDGRILPPAMEAQVEGAMRDHVPEDYGIDSALWTRRAVRALIEKMCDIKLPIRTVGEYLKRWEYSPHRPLK